MKVGVVACSKTKRDVPAPAAELYLGRAFRASRAIAERCSKWRILSARHGCINPTRIVEPYSTYLADLDNAQRAEWANWTRGLLAAEFPTATFVVLGGAHYRAGVPYPQILPGGYDCLGMLSQAARLADVARRPRKILVIGKTDELEARLGCARGALGKVADTALLGSTPDSRLDTYGYPFVVRDDASWWAEPANRSWLAERMAPWKRA